MLIAFLAARRVALYTRQTALLLPTWNKNGGTVDIGSTAILTRVPPCLVQSRRTFEDEGSGPIGTEATCFDLSNKL